MKKVPNFKTFLYIGLAIYPTLLYALSPADDDFNEERGTPSTKIIQEIPGDFDNLSSFPEAFALQGSNSNPLSAISINLESAEDITLKNSTHTNSSSFLENEIINFYTVNNKLSNKSHEEPTNIFGYSLSYSDHNQSSNLFSPFGFDLIGQCDFQITNDGFAIPSPSLTPQFSLNRNLENWEPKNILTFNIFLPIERKDPLRDQTSSLLNSITAHPQSGLSSDVVTNDIIRKRSYTNMELIEQINKLKDYLKKKIPNDRKNRYYSLSRIAKMIGVDLKTLKDRIKKNAELKEIERETASQRKTVRRN